MNIEVDFEVWKALTSRRVAEATTCNDVLRELLELPAITASPQVPSEGWTSQGVTLPDGTELRANYQGKVYTATITNGQWMQDGESRSSPTAAARAITNGTQNGWWFWAVRRPGDGDWMQLGQLRRGRI